MTVRERYLTLQPRDPLVARDGRPFAAGLRMRSLDSLYPSVLAGSLRTFLGQAAGGFSTNEVDYKAFTDDLKDLNVAGPFPLVGGQLCFPAPADFVVRRDPQDGVLEGYGARPVSLARFSDAGTNLPLLPDSGDRLEPVVLPDTVEEDFKPCPVPPLWSRDVLVRWLTDSSGTGFLAASTRSWPAGMLLAPRKDTRTHVALNADTGAAETGMLYQTTGLCFDHLEEANVPENGRGVKAELAVRVSGAGFSELDTLQGWHPLGGERRLCFWQPATNRDVWQCPPEIRTALSGLSGPKLVRMVLATPGYFTDGWRPGWLSGGTIPGTKSLRAKLVGASFDRWRPLSGWSYEPKTYGPKAVKRLVPAGAVYFLEVDGNPAELADCWLKPVGDDPQLNNDGFSLAVWGTWSRTS